MIRQYKAIAKSTGRGQAAVETAIILPIIMLLALGTFDLGRGIIAHIALQEATHEGAVFAGYELANPNSTVDEDDVIYRVKSSSSADAVTLAVVTAPCATDKIVVTSTYQLPLITPIGSFIFGPSLAIGVQVTATNFHGVCP